MHMNPAVAVPALLTVRAAAQQLQAAKKDVQPAPTAGFHTSYAEAGTSVWRESLRASLAQMPVGAAAGVLDTVSSKGDGGASERQY